MNKRAPIFILILILFTAVKGQNTIKLEIDLPQINQIELTEIKDSPYYSIYISKEKQVYFENDRIRFWREIPLKIDEKEAYPIRKKVNFIKIYADENIPYNLFLRLRMEIGKNWKGMLLLIGNERSQDKGLLYYINGSELGYSSYATHNTEMNSPIIDLKDTPNIDPWTENDRNGYIYFPLPIGWQETLAGVFFNKHITQLKNIVKLGITYTDLYFFDKDQFQNNISTFRIKDVPSLKSLSEKNDLIFLTFSEKITYGQYYRIRAELERFRHTVKDGNHGILKKPFYIEASVKFVEKMNQLGFPMNGIEE